MNGSVLKKHKIVDLLVLVVILCTKIIYCWYQIIPSNWDKEHRVNILYNKEKIIHMDEKQEKSQEIVKRNKTQRKWNVTKQKTIKTNKIDKTKIKEENALEWCNIRSRSVVFPTMTRDMYYWH